MGQDAAAASKGPSRSPTPSSPIPDPESGVQELLDAFKTAFILLNTREPVSSTEVVDTAGPSQPAVDSARSLALKLYSKAAQLEAVGSLGKGSAAACIQNVSHAILLAMELYSRAFKLDPDVETHIDRDVLQATIQQTMASINLGNFQNQSHRSAYPPLNSPSDQQLLGSLLEGGHSLGPLLDQLPEDLLQQILVELGYLHVASLELVARTCREFYYQCRKMADLWPRVFFHRCLTPIRSHPINATPAPLSYTEFMALPRIRTDGIYICKITYFRQGYDMNATHQPLHVVTYYRYLRFWWLAGKQCVAALVTTDRPQVAVERMRGFPMDSCHAVRKSFISASKERRKPADSPGKRPESPLSSPIPANYFIGQYWRSDQSPQQKGFVLRLYDAHATQPLHLSMHMHVADGPSALALKCTSYTARKRDSPLVDCIHFDIANWSKFYFSRVKSFRT